ncbi:MAG: hypothetical protein U5R49_08240 [Deltaproteobacteria bacterium]|nr:hypothetical protein [Deltaproteobacteria bacterium]
MASKSKTSRLGQKRYWEEKLNQRLSELEQGGVSPKDAAKDTAVQSFRAKLRETEKRLAVIEDREKKLEEMARLKAEKRAAPRKDKPKKGKKAQTEETQAESKRQQKKKKKQSAKKEKED